MSHSAQDENFEPMILQEKIIKKSGEIIIKKYVRGRVLGKGGSATCYEATDLEKNKVLVGKIVPKTSLTKKRSLAKLLDEIRIHKRLEHPHIVQFEHVFEDKDNVYILLELCPNQTLKDLLKKRKRFSEAECATYLIQTISALKYLHSKNIIHRDIKLGNMLLGKSSEIKLTDFGLAAKIEQDGERRRTVCGTPNYIAPEVLDKSIGHSYEVDVWSLGVVFYTLLIGRPPFETNDAKSTYKRILKLQYSFPANVQISENAKDLIRKILVLTPSKRPTLDEILEHPFFRENTHNKQINDEMWSLNKESTFQPAESMTQPLGMSAYEREFFHTVTTPAETQKDINHEKGIDGQLDLNADINKPVPGAGKLDSRVVVIKWIDCSSKYGLGYLLSNGSVGILFSDLSKMTLAPDGTKFDYLTEDPEQNREVFATMSTSDYPQELENKLALLNSFKSYLQETPGNEREEKGIENGDMGTNSPPLVYVKKWMKTKHALLFKLSNKLVQLDFTDQSRLILDPLTETVLYRNKKGEQSEHALATALGSSYTEMVKRLKYTKDILECLKTQDKENGVSEGAIYENVRAEQE